LRVQSQGGSGRVGAPWGAQGSKM